VIYYTNLSNLKTTKKKLKPPPWESSRHTNIRNLHPPLLSGIQS
jgi:hypothetical protein